MTPRYLQTAIRLLAVIIATYAVAPSFAQKATFRYTRTSLPTPEGYRSVSSDGCRPERQDFQGRLYEPDGSCVRQTG
jgi:hypothetical protein